MSEPFFTQSLLPWHDLYMWYTRTEISSLLVDNPIVIPGSAVLRAIGVEFSDLWKIRADVGNCEGFDLSHFDRMIEVRCQTVRLFICRIIDVRSSQTARVFI